MLNLLTVLIKTAFSQSDGHFLMLLYLVPKKEVQYNIEVHLLYN